MPTHPPGERGARRLAATPTPACPRTAGGPPGAARGLRPPGAAGERRVEFPGGVHPPRRSLRPLPPRRVGALGRSGAQRRRSDAGGGAASTGCAATGAAPGARGREDRARGGDGARRRGLSLPLGPRRRPSRRGWPQRTGRWRARPGSSRRASWARWAGPVAAHVTAAHPWRRHRARRLRRGQPARRASATAARRRTASSPAAHWPCAPSSAAARSRSPRRRSTWRPEPDGDARRDRAERGGRPAPAARAPATAHPVPAHARTRCAARRRVRARPAPGRGRRRARTWSRAARCTRRPGSSCSIAPGSSTSPRSRRAPGGEPALRPGGQHPLVSGIHHFVPVLHRGDAVGRHTLRLRDATRARGVRSEIFVDTVDAETASRDGARALVPRAAQPGDVVVYQFATASAMAPWLAGRSETLVVNYHNVTPPELMAPWDNHLALGQLQAQGDLRAAGAAHRARRGRLRLQRGAPGRGRLRQHGRHPAVGRARRTRRSRPPRHRRRRRRRGRRATRPAAARAGSPSAGCRRTRRSRAPSPRSPWPGRTATPARRSLVIGKPATDSYVAALQRYVVDLGLAAAVQLHRPCERCHRGVGLCRGRRAGRDVRARGILRAGRRGDGRRSSRRGLRPGGGARGARRGRRARVGQGPLRAGGGHRTRCSPTHPVATPSSRPGAGAWPSSTSMRRRTGSSTCSSPWPAPAGHPS